MNYYSLLTKRAADALDFATEEYKMLILSEAFNISKRNGTEGEIAHKDIIEAIQKNFYQNLYSNKTSEVTLHDIAHTDTNNIQSGTIFNLKYEKIKTYILSLIIISLAYISFGSLVYFVTEYDLLNNTHSMFSFVAFGVIGIIISVFLYLFLLLYNRMVIIKGEILKSRNLDLEIKILWDDIENYGYKLLKDKIPSDTALNASSVIDYLIEILKCEGEDLKLRKVLQARNYIVSNDSLKVSSDNKEKIISMAKEILTILEEIMNKEKDKTGIE